MPVEVVREDRNGMAGLTAAQIEAGLREARSDCDDLRGGSRIVCRRGADLVEKSLRDRSQFLSDLGSHSLVIAVQTAQFRCRKLPRPQQAMCDFGVTAAYADAVSISRRPADDVCEDLPPRHATACRRGVAFFRKAVKE